MPVLREWNLLCLTCEAKENGSPLANPVAHLSSPSVSDPSAIQLDSVPNNQNVEASWTSNNGVRSLFGVSSSAQPKICSEDVQSSSVRGMLLPTENELLVNEIMHWKPCCKKIICSCK